MVRSLLVPIAVLGASAMLGCERREAVDPSEIIADDVARAAPPPRSLSRSSAHVTCKCDAEGGLHVVAPQGSTVTSTEREGEADIVLPDEAPGQPIRRTKSLGFIGDNKLTNDGPHYVDQGGYSFPPSFSHYGGGYGYRSRSYSRFGGGTYRAPR